jgi:glycyl-tRNA synthetase (class II)
MSGESMEYGFWNRADNSINIHKDYIRSNQTILEELAHYITGATDNSRDFQDYAFKLATAFMGLK